MFRTEVGSDKGHDEVSGDLAVPGYMNRGTIGSRGAECAVSASEEGEVPEYSGRFPRTPRWVCRAPAVNAAVIAAAAFRRGTPGCATAALPPSSPAPRQYARELVTTG